MYIYKYLSEATKGHFDVLLNQSHLKDILFQHVAPPPIDMAYNKFRVRRWVHMGFPTMQSNTYPSLCSCHGEWTYRGFICSRCGAKQCELPTSCRICGLTLVSSSHLARSYHHLFPIDHFEEISDPTSSPQCFGCSHAIDLEEELVLQCTHCSMNFCSECDEYVHQTLYNCPGCLSHPV